MLPYATWHKDIDLVAVQRAVSCLGECPSLTRDEQRHTVRVMTEAGVGGDVIAGRLGISDRTVTRWRDEMGLSS